MCGIFGYIGHQQALPLLVEGLRRLEYRGYDSAGIAVEHEGTITTHKTVGKVADLKSVLPSIVEGTLGIAHTRWATHGGVTQVNTHPHASDNGKVHLVHNGIIENFQQLRKGLEARGITCVSETDSEVIAQMIALALDKGASPTKAVRSTLRRLRGTWGLCILFKDHDMLICARNGSPLIIGQGDGETFVSSDPHPLTAHTQRVVFLRTATWLLSTAIRSTSRR